LTGSGLVKLIQCDEATRLVGSKSRNVETARRAQGWADPGRLQRQTAGFGTSIDGMPAIQVSRNSMGNLVINDGVTRATRVAKLLPKQKLVVEVIDDLPIDLSALPTVGDQLP
jgi:hypothetical protein